MGVNKYSFLSTGEKWYWRILIGLFIIFLLWVAYKRSEPLNRTDFFELNNGK